MIGSIILYAFAHWDALIRRSVILRTTQPKVTSISYCRIKQKCMCALICFLGGCSLNNATFLLLYVVMRPSVIRFLSINKSNLNLVRIMYVSYLYRGYACRYACHKLDRMLQKKDIIKGAHRGKNQPVPFRGIKAFCYGEPKVCPDFQDGAKKQPVPWHSGTG